jgi:ABC-2 type transport system permease protein
LRANDSLNVQATDLATARQQIKRRQSLGVVIIPAGFGENVGVFWSDPVALRVGRDPSRGAESAMLEGFLMEAASKLLARRWQDTTATRELLQKQKREVQQNESLTAVNKLLLTQVLSSVDQLFNDIDQLNQRADEPNDETKEETSDQEVPVAGFQLAKIETFDALESPATPTGPTIRSGWDLSFPQSILWGVMGSAAGFAISLVRERSRGTLLRLQTAPIAPLQILLGKGLACFVATLLVVALMVALGLFLGMRPQSPWLLVGSALVVAFCFVGIMMAMSALGSTEEGVGGAGWAINMVMAMFGGAMMPLAFMPPFMKTLSDASPVKWAILALEAAIWRNYTLGELAIPWAILVAIGSAGLVMGLIVFQRSLNR